MLIAILLFCQPLIAGITLIDAAATVAATPPKRCCCCCFRRHACRLRHDTPLMPPLFFCYRLMPFDVLFSMMMFCCRAIYHITLFFLYAICSHIHTSPYVTRYGDAPCQRLFFFSTRFIMRA